MTDFKSVKKVEIPKAKQFKYLPQVKKDYRPRASYEFLTKKEKESVDGFDLKDLNWNLAHDNVLNVLWVCGILADKIKKYPNAPVSSHHQEILEKIAQIFEEWGLINERLK